MLPSSLQEQRPRSRKSSSDILPLSGGLKFHTHKNIFDYQLVCLARAEALTLI